MADVLMTTAKTKSHRITPKVHFVMRVSPSSVEFDIVGRRAQNFLEARLHITRRSLHVAVGTGGHGFGQRNGLICGNIGRIFDIAVVHPGNGMPAHGPPKRPHSRRHCLGLREQLVAFDRIEPDERQRGDLRIGRECRRNARVAGVSVGDIPLVERLHKVERQIDVAHRRAIGLGRRIEKRIMKRQPRKTNPGVTRKLECSGERKRCAGAVTEKCETRRIDVALRARSNHPNRSHHIVKGGWRRVFRRKPIIESNHMHVERIANPLAQRVFFARIAEREKESACGAPQADGEKKTDEKKTDEEKTEE